MHSTKQPARPLAPIVRNPEDPPFHRSMCCFVHRVEYDFDERSGLVILDDGCTDMRGAIETFTAIDPECKAIVTQQKDGELETVYRCGSDGVWRAYDPQYGQMS